MKLTQKFGTPANVAANGHMVAPLPIGLSYETVFIYQTAGTFAASDFSNIKLNANSKPIQEYRTGTELNVDMLFDKRTTASTNKILVVDLNRRLLPNQAQREFTKLGTGKPANLQQYVTVAGGQQLNPDYNPYPVQTLTLEADLSSTFSASGAISIYAIQSPAAPTGLIKKVRPFNFGPTATPFDIPDYPKGDLIDRIRLKDPTGGPITNVQILRDNYTIFDRTNTLNSLIQTDGTYRSPQSGYFVIDTCEEGLGLEVIATAGVNDFRLRVNTSANPSGGLETSVTFIGNLDR
jgi:hypothetical protein